MSVTIGNIVQDALGIIGEVTGVGTQLYSEPRMIKDAGRAFNMLFKKHWWKQYAAWTTVVLDETTGVITTNAFTQVIDFSDFAAVHRAGEDRPLPTLPESINPNTITGDSPRFWTSLHVSHASFVTRKLKIYPIAATGSLDVKARFHPITVGQDWQTATIVYLDRDLLALGTAFNALSGDDINPAAKVDVQNMMEGKYKDIMNSLSDQEMGHTSKDPVPRTWFSPYP